MSQTYYVRMQNRSLGPYALDRLRQMTKKGQIGRSHEVSTDGMSWAPASSFPEIFERPADPAPEPRRVEPAEQVQQKSTVPVRAESNWYCTVAGEQQGPISLQQLVSLVRAGRVTATDHVFREGNADWTLAGDAPELVSAFGPTAPTGPGSTPSPGIDAFCRECGAGVSRRAIMCPKCGAPVVQDLPPGPGGDFEFAPATVSGRRGHQGKSRTTAAILALLIGGFGLHHFYLGNAALGIVYILFCWTFIPAIISFIEAIIFLTMSDDTFDAKYNS